jgi:hypothetical protein
VCFASHIRRVGVRQVVAVACVTLVAAPALADYGMTVRKTQVRPGDRMTIWGSGCRHSPRFHLGSGSTSRKSAPTATTTTGTMKASSTISARARRAIWNSSAATSPCATMRRNGEDVHLFEQESTGIRYIGQFTSAGFNWRDDVPDKNGNLRRAIVFELVALNDELAAPIASTSASSDPRWTMPLAVLRDRERRGHWESLQAQRSPGAMSMSAGRPQGLRSAACRGHLRRLW